MQLTSTGRLNRLLLLAIGAVLAGSPQLPAAPQDPVFPKWVQTRANAERLWSRFTVHRVAGRSSGAGDFDADGRSDFAVLVQSRQSGETGIVVFLTSREGMEQVGGGLEHEALGADLSWMDDWAVLRRADVRTTDALPKGRGDFLHLIKQEAASGFLHWSGNRFRWIQEGD